MVFVCYKNGKFLLFLFAIPLLYTVMKVSVTVITLAKRYIAKQMKTVQVRSDEETDSVEITITLIGYWSNWL